MNTELRNIISDFQVKVEEANELLKKYLKTEEPHNWRAITEQVGVLGGKYRYFFHGVGCRVHLSMEDEIDFDYGANGRIDGFDEWRLCGFISVRCEKYPHIKESDIKVWFQDAIDKHEIIRSESREYGNLYYLVKNT